MLCPYQAQLAGFTSNINIMQKELIFLHKLGFMVIIRGLKKSRMREICSSVYQEWWVSRSQKETKRNGEWVSEWVSGQPAMSFSIVILVWPAILWGVHANIVLGVPIQACWTTERQASACGCWLAVPSLNHTHLSHKKIGETFTYLRNIQIITWKWERMGCYDICWAMVAWLVLDHPCMPWFPVQLEQQFNCYIFRFFLCFLHGFP
jgi:hypothetical protein